jgi:CRP-like cAMP-binding protein
MARLADRIRAGQWLAISYLGMALAMIVYSLSLHAALAILMMGVSGLWNAPSFIGEQLVIQRAAPREMRGRVYGAYFVMRDVMYVAGMMLAGLADLWNVRTLFITSAFLLVLVGAVALRLPALGETLTEWKRTLKLLRGLEAAPRLGMGRAASRVEIDRFIHQMPGLETMTSLERDEFAAQAFIAQSPPGVVVVYRGETSDMAYFILKGSVGVGLVRDQEYMILEYKHPGEFFGEVAALSGMPRTANIITEEECEFLVIPAQVIKRLAREYPSWNGVLQSLMGEHLSRTERPLATGYDQEMLRNLRTNQPDVEPTVALA